MLSALSFRKNESQHPPEKEGVHENLKAVRIRKKSILHQIGLLLGMSIATLSGGALASGCSSAPKAAHHTEPLREASNAPEKTERAISHAVTTRILRESPHEFSWDDEISLEDSYQQNIIAISNSVPGIGFGESSVREYDPWVRATRHAVLERMSDIDENEVLFPISFNFGVDLTQNRTNHPLANYDFINSTRQSLDNLFACSLHSIGQYQQLNHSVAYRSTAFGILFLEMLATSRLGHEFAHGFDETIRRKKPLPVKGFLFAEGHNGENISYEDLILSQAAGLNNSSIMATRYWQQAETRGNIVSSLGFMISRNDALMQWIYGHLIMGGDPEKIIQRQIKAIQSHPGASSVNPITSLEEFEEDFETEEKIPEEALDPAIYQVTGHGDNVAYIKLLETMGYGKAHRDKDLAIILGSNAMTAYFWQSLYEIIQYIGYGKMSHERWRLAGPVEWPLFSTYRLPRGYLTQAQLPIVIRNDIVDRITLIGGKDLDPILGNLNLHQLGAGASGNLPGELRNIRWSVSSVISMQSDDWTYSGHQVQAGLAYQYGPFALSIQGTFHHRDPLRRNVYLEKNGFSLMFGAEIQLDPNIRRPLKQFPENTPRTEVFTHVDIDDNQPIYRDTDKPAPSETMMVSKR